MYAVCATQSWLLSIDVHGWRVLMWLSRYVPSYDSVPTAISPPWTQQGMDTANTRKKKVTFEPVHAHAQPPTSS